MTKKAMIEAAVEALGLGTTRAQINLWIQRKYNVAVPDGTIAPTLAKLRKGKPNWPKGGKKKNDVMPLSQVLGRSYIDPVSSA